MKGLKITTLILAAAMMAMPIAGCNNSKKPVSSGINIISSQSQNGLSGENAGMIDPNAAANNFIFKYNGVNVVVNTKMEDIEGKFDSKTYKKTSQVSCIGAAGTDWVGVYRRLLGEHVWEEERLLKLPVNTVLFRLDEVVKMGREREKEMRKARRRRG